MMSLILGKKHTKLLIFNIKVIVDWNFFTFIIVLGMSKISKNIGFDALLVLSRIRFTFFLPHLLFVAVFAPLTSIITTFFDCKAMTPYNHAF